MISLRWNIHKPATAFSLFGLALLLSLGLWQLRRADEKRVVQAAFDAQQSAAPIDLSQLTEQPAQYTRVHLRGRYDNSRSLFLDNRVLHGRFGYEVLTVFVPAANEKSVANEKVILVNRGWIEGDPSRLQRPQIAAVEGEVDLVGAVYRDTARFHFVDNAHETSWPKLIQHLKPDDLQQQIGSPAYPFIVRLDESMPGAYRIEWQVVAEGFGPERHIGYAVTWFVLAFALVIVWLISNSNITELLRNSHGD
jgi:surfeit locus 1 family protein